MKKQSTLFILLIIGITMMVSSCKNEKQELKESVKYVKIAEVNSSADHEKINFNGSVKEKRMTSLSFRVGGPIVKLNVETGDFVQKGEVIAEIDPRDYKLQLKSTEAQYLQIKGEYSRYQQLFDHDKIPANSYEKIKSAFQMAETAYNNAKNQLKDTELRAPYSGYVFEKFIENHQTIGPGQAIISLLDLSELEVVVSVPENQISRLRTSNSALLDVPNAQIEKMPIQLFSIGEKTQKNGMYEVKYIFKNSEDIPVSPGMTAEVNIRFQSEQQALTIPSSSLFYKDGKTCVWIYNHSSQTIKQKEIKVQGYYSETLMIVLDGLTKGDSIVTTGVSYLSNGEKVEPIKKRSKTNIGGLL